MMNLHDLTAAEIDDIRKADLVMVDGVLVYGLALCHKVKRTGESVQAGICHLDGVDPEEALAVVQRIKSGAYDGQNRLSAN